MYSTLKIILLGQIMIVHYKQNKQNPCGYKTTTGMTYSLTSINHVFFFCFLIFLLFFFFIIFFFKCMYFNNNVINNVHEYMFIFKIIDGKSEILNTSIEHQLRGYTYPLYLIYFSDLTLKLLLLRKQLRYSQL